MLSMISLSLFFLRVELNHRLGHNHRRGFESCLLRLALSEEPSGSSLQINLVFSNSAFQAYQLGGPVANYIYIRRAT